MGVGLTLLRDGKADALVSAGSTGALLAGATLITKRIRGIRRAAMAPVIPTTGGRAVLIDCGANAECTPEYLLQFAYLGSFYAGRVLAPSAGSTSAAATWPRTSRILATRRSRSQPGRRRLEEAPDAGLSPDCAGA